ncbi:MAG: O-sialoglycoprotein endopeptidase, partial [Bacilli bacterium]|nr:O-sialoglycoprotein endopeptidase [Bacilli bacterium]
MILGIDTSNYMTSVCLLDNQGTILFDGRRLLQVPAGKRGLQQSAALFEHLKALPRLFQEMGPIAKNIRVIGYSEKPRPLQESYMPVFQAGGSFAISMAAALGVPAFATTHQEGHIAAGEASLTRVVSGPADLIARPEFLAVHLSGGTTDLLHVRRGPFGYEIELLGSGMDLHAGQFVDRVGVALGLR